MLLLKHLRNALMVKAPISLCPRQNLQLAVAGHEPVRVLRRSDWLDQARVSVLDIADAHAHRPADHLL